MTVSADITLLYELVSLLLLLLQLLLLWCGQMRLCLWCCSLGLPGLPWLHLLVVIGLGRFAYREGGMSCACVCECDLNVCVCLCVLT